MTTPYQAAAPARFFTLPDGTQSHLQVKVVPDATGETFTVAPAEVVTLQQLAEWEQIQAAAPLTRTEALTRQLAASAKPLFKADAEADDVTGAQLLDDARFAAEAQAATSAVTEVSAAPVPVGSVQWQQRADAAARAAASLGLLLTWVRDAPTGKSAVPAHFEIWPVGEWARDIVAAEQRLTAMARDRAKRDEQIQRWADNRARIERERQEAIANLPENRIARLEAKLAAAGIAV